MRMSSTETHRQGDIEVRRGMAFFALAFKTQWHSVTVEAEFKYVV